MKKRFLGALLALCMCLTLLPGTARSAYEPPTEVFSVSVSVPTPVADGKFADAKPTAKSSAPYFVGSSRWTRVTARGGTADADTAWSDSFQADSWYQLSIELLLDYGYVYADNAAAQVPGAEMVEVERSGDDTVYVNAWFKVGDPAAAAEIGRISISNVPTARMEKVADWTNAIKAATISDTCRISDAYLYAWDSAESEWSICYSSGSTDSGKVYGAWLTINSLPGYTFSDTVSASVNGDAAEITKQSMDKVEIFVPFGTVTISSVEVRSATWPIDGNPIRKDPENFTGGGVYVGYTLESAQFQIKDINGGWRALNGDETKFNKYSEYRVTAVLKAQSYATFASGVTGDFNGTSGTECAITDSNRTCIVTRTCAVYEPVYTFPAGDPGSQINGVTIYRDDPVEGKSYADDAFSPDGESIRLSGATETYEWHEVSCVGSIRSLKKLTKDDTFEAGKVYYALMWLRADGNNNRRFDDEFTVSFKQRDGSHINCAQLKCITNSKQTKQYGIWYIVGDGTQQEITQVAITGPAYQNGTVDIGDLTAFHTSDPVTISNPYFYSYNNQLSFYITAKSGHYFGRTVTVTYNGKAAEASNPLFFYGDRFTAKEVRVSYDATPVTVSGITVETKTYDGTVAAALTDGTLDGVAAGHVVSLDFSGVTAAFEDANAGKNKTVTVTGEVRLAGADAYRYRLIRPDLTGLTATIEPHTAFDDVTNQTQTIMTGSDSFTAPRFTGIGGELVEGTVAYNMIEATEADIPGMLRGLKAGESLYIPYTFTASGNYTGTKSGTITVTAEDAPTTYAVRIAESEHGAVSSSRRWAEYGRTVTLTVTPESGYALETLTVTDSRSKELTLTDLGGGKYSFRMPSGRVTVTASFLEDNSVLNFFVDVAKADYFYESVKWAVENGVTEGVDDAHFDPDGDCTRAQIVTFLWRAAGCPEAAGEVRFADVDPDAYYAKAVAWAVESGVTQGTGETAFSPLRPCTRAEAVTFLARALNAKADPTAAFDDVDPEAYYAAAVAWAVENGITEGTGEGTFSPEARCTRAQIVTFLWRVYEK